MFFNYFLALALPPIFGVYLYLVLGGKKTIINIIGVTTIMCLVINNLLYFVLIYIKNQISWDFYGSNMLTLKYSIVSIFLAFLISNLIRFIELNIKLKLKVDKSV